MSLPEVLLWTKLRKRPGGHKFRKQFPLGEFALDFACVASRLAIEVDGESHNRGDQPEFDRTRDEKVRAYGFATLRIAAREVLKNMDGALTQLVHTCDRRSQNPPRNGEVARQRRDGGAEAVPPSRLLHHRAPPGGLPSRSGEDL